MKTTGECLSAETIEAGPARGDRGLPESGEVNCSILALSARRLQYFFLEMPRFIALFCRTFPSNLGICLPR